MVDTETPAADASNGRNKRPSRGDDGSVCKRYVDEVGAVWGCVIEAIELIGFTDGWGMSERESTLVACVGGVWCCVGVGWVDTRGTRWWEGAMPTGERSDNERGAPREDGLC